MSRSQWEELADWPDERLSALLDALGEAGREALLHDWAVQARPEQMAPKGDWRIWLMLAGRGFGKTRSGAEWVRSVAEKDGKARIALVGASLHDARSVMVEGGSQLLTSFMQQQLAQSAVITITPRLLGGLGAIGTSLAANGSAAAATPRLTGVSYTPAGEDLVVWGDFAWPQAAAVARPPQKRGC